MVILYRVTVLCVAIHYISEEVRTVAGKGMYVRWEGAYEFRVRTTNPTAKYLYAILDSQFYLINRKRKIE